MRNASNFVVRSYLRRGLAFWTCRKVLSLVVEVEGLIGHPAQLAVVSWRALSVYFFMTVAVLKQQVVSLSLANLYSNFLSST